MSEEKEKSENMFGYLFKSCVGRCGCDRGGKEDEGGESALQHSSNGGGARRRNGSCGDGHESTAQLVKNGEDEEEEDEVLVKVKQPRPAIRMGILKNASKSLEEPRDEAKLMLAEDGGAAAEYLEDDDDDSGACVEEEDGLANNDKLFPSSPQGDDCQVASDVVSDEGGPVEIDIGCDSKRNENGASGEAEGEWTASEAVDLAPDSPAVVIVEPAEGEGGVAGAAVGGKGKFLVTPLDEKDLQDLGAGAAMTPPSSSPLPPPSSYFSASRSRKIQRFTVTAAAASDLEEQSDERVQLTVSSVNTVLEDLQETDDENDDDEGEGTKEEEAKKKRRERREAAEAARKLAAAAAKAAKEQQKGKGKHIPRPPLTNRAFFDKAAARAAFTAKRQSSYTGTPANTSNSSNNNSSNSNPSYYSTVIGAIGTTPGSRPKKQSSSSSLSSRHNSGDGSSFVRPALKKQQSCSTAEAESRLSGSNQESITSTGARPRSRERSPCVVSFDETPTYHGPGTRRRSRSDAYRFKFRSLSISGGSAAAKNTSGGSSGSIPGLGSKMAWLLDRHKEKMAAVANPALEGEEASGGRDGEVEETEAKASSSTTATQSSSWFRKSPAPQPSSSATDVDRPTKQMRPRTKSAKLDRAAKKAVVAEVSKSSAFEWPLGRLGKLKQKYRRKEAQRDNQGGVSRSASASALTAREVERLISSNARRRHSLRGHKGRGGRSVGFAAEGGGGGIGAQSGVRLAASLWTASLKFLLGDYSTSSSGGRGRRRHFTDPGLILLRQSSLHFMSRLPKNS